MFKFSHGLIATILVVTSVHAAADISSMGMNYRKLMSNYRMLHFIKGECPELTFPDIEPRPKVEQLMQKKLGMQTYVKIMIAIQKSDLSKNAKISVENLIAATSGCNDPEMARALTRIELEHIQAYARFKGEPALVKPRNVPVPMRRQ